MLRSGNDLRLFLRGALSRAQPLERREHVGHLVLLHKRGTEEAFDGGVEGGRIVEGHHVGCVGKTTSCALGMCR